MFLNQKSGIYYFFALLTAFFLSGCAPINFAWLKHPAPLPAEPACYIKGVPFIKQKENWCGPVALAEILNFWGAKISQEEIANELYLKSAKGTLTLDMESYSDKWGLCSLSYKGSLEDAKSKISKGIPVIVLQKKKEYLFLNKNHYLVLIGYDDANKYFVAHSGTKENAVIPYKKLTPDWQRAKFWTLVVSPPERVDWELDAQGFYKVGILLEQKGLLGSAIENYKRSLEKEKNARAFFNLGNVYSKKNQFDEAIASYEAALRLDTYYADCYNNLANVYVSLGKNLEEAKRCIEHAILLNPDGAMYYFDTLGLIELKMGLGEKALASFGRAKEAAGHNAGVIAVIDGHINEARYNSIDKEVTLLEDARGEGESKGN